MSRAATWEESPLESVTVSEARYVPGTSGVKDGEVAAGSVSSAVTLPGGLVNDQAKENVSPRLQVPPLSASVAVAVRATAVPMLGFAGAAAAAVIVGTALPQAVAVSWACPVLDVLPVESVTTTENWYEPGTSGVNEGLAAVGSDSVALLPAGLLDTLHSKRNVCP